MMSFIFKRYGWMLVGACILSMASAAAGIGVLTVLNTELELLGYGDTSLTKLPLFIGMILGMVLLGLFAQYLLAKLSAGVVAEMRNNIVSRVLRADFEHVEKIGGHKIYAILNSDTARINKGISTIPEYTYSLSSVILSLAYIGYLSLELLGLLLVFIATAMLLVKFLLSRASRVMSALRKNDDELFQHYQVLVEGNKELNINHDRKRFFYNKLFLPTTVDAKRNTIRSQLDFALLSNISNAFVFSAMICIVYGAGLLLPHLSIEILIGTMLVFIYMVGPLSYVVDSFSSIVDAFIGYKKVRLFESELNSNPIICLENKSNAATKIQTFNNNWKSIRFVNVVYQYSSNDGDKQFSIGPINLTLKRGEVNFITGGNGSGKSTFAKLLCGLYKPVSGKVFVDNAEVDYEKNILSYRQLFTTIFSDFYLFDHVLDETGALAGDDKVMDQLCELNMQDKVRVTGGKLSTTRLSHGQRKRIALMQAYIENAPICLFDEWAADQDAYFRRYFYLKILPSLKESNKLIVAISHDDRYFKHCDRLFKFDQGLVSELNVSSLTTTKEEYERPSMVKGYAN